MVGKDRKQHEIVSQYRKLQLVSLTAISNSKQLPWWEVASKRI